MSSEQIENSNKDFTAEDAQQMVAIYHANMMWKVILLIKEQIAKLAQSGLEYGEFRVPAKYYIKIVSILTQDKFEVSSYEETTDSSGESFINLGISWK